MKTENNNRNKEQNNKLIKGCHLQTGIRFACTVTYNIAGCV